MTRRLDAEEAAPQPEREAAPPPAGPAPAPSHVAVLTMQRTAGNAATAAFLGGRSAAVARQPEDGEPRPAAPAPWAAPPAPVSAAYPPPISPTPTAVPSSRAAAGPSAAMAEAPSAAAVGAPPSAVPGGASAAVVDAPPSAVAGGASPVAGGASAAVVDAPPSAVAGGGSAAVVDAPPAVAGGASAAVVDAPPAVAGGGSAAVVDAPPAVAGGASAGVVDAAPPADAASAAVGGSPSGEAAPGGPAAAAPVAAPAAAIDLSALGGGPDDGGASVVAELGGGGGGGTLRPSALGEGLEVVRAAGDAALGEAGSRGETLAASAPVPEGPAPETPAAPAAPAPVQIGEPAAPAAAVAEVDGKLATTDATAALGEHAAEIRRQATGARESADAAVEGFDAGPVGPTAAPAPPPRPVAAAPPAPSQGPQAAVPDGGLEGPVAQVLDAGFSTKLSESAQQATGERAQAMTEHRDMLQQADDAHRQAVTTNQAAVTKEAETIKGNAQSAADSHKAAWRAENASLTGAFEREVHAEQQTAASEVQQHGSSANAAAQREVATAAEQAEKEQEGGGLWSRITSFGSDLLRAGGEALSSLSEGARNLVQGALDRARGLLDSARQAIVSRVERYVAAVRDVVARARDALAAAAQRAVAAIRNAVAAARAALDAVVARVRELAGRLLRTLADAIARAASWLASKLRTLFDGIVALGRRILALAGTVRQLLALAGSKVVKGIMTMVQDPLAVLDPFKAQVGGWMAALPDKAREYYEQLVEPLAGGPGPAPEAATGGQGARLQRRALQRQEEHGAPAAEPTHGAIVWEYVKERLSYLGEHWLAAIGNVLLEIFVPFVSMIRHVPPMVMAIFRALRDVFTGRFSDAIDEALLAARELSALLSTAFAQFAIIAFIAGSIFGTPIIGEGAMVAIGLIALGVDAVIQGASIAKAWWNLDRPGRSGTELNEDYSNIADSIVSLGVTAALLVIAFIGQKLGKAVLAKFPRVASALESIRARLREKLGIKTPHSGQPVVDTPKGAPPVAPEATGYPGRGALTPVEQRAFDRFIADRTAKGTLSPEFDARLKAATADELRKMVKGYMSDQPQAELDAAEREAKRRRAQDTNASDPLDPVMSNRGGPEDGVTWRWNEVEPSRTEIDQAKGIAARTGEPVELFGDGYRGIDGAIGNPRRPLQLKGIPQAKGPPEVHRSVVVAYDKAKVNGFQQVEVHVTAEGMSVAQVEAEFLRPTVPGTFMDGQIVRRVVVWCTDGAYVPTGPVIPTPPIHVDGENREPAGATTGGG